ncbi:O-antigen ligase family protein [Colwellia sp. KU-HH00111]|uniref:O-antigen ligase family protein n=1 Tax=Colwellia sp. KU-HH00111 TaxID=3127652 RepID=UPI0033658DFA
MAAINTNIKLVPILITFFLFELFIGGSGQVFKFFNIPFRQIIFAVILLIFLFDLITRNIRFTVNFISLNIVFILLGVLLSAILGLINAHKASIIIKDVTPMLYFLLYFPLHAYFLKYNITYAYVLRILVHSTVIMSIAVIITFLILNIAFNGDLYIFRAVIEQTIGKDVFWFRANGFVFYPGLVYSLVAAILLFGKLVAYKKLSLYEIFALSLSIFALVISMTKGLILSLAIGFLLLIFTKKTTLMTKMSSIVLCVIITSILFSLFDFSRFTDLSNDTGTNTRIKTIEESTEVINENVILGNGFGTELPTKKFHQENSFIDIFVEQGLVGLSLYLIMFTYIFIRRKVNIDITIAASTVAIMSLTNPYVNNPLGIGLIILTLIFIGNDKVVVHE